MIVNGTLTYPSTPSLFHRELSNPTLNLIAIAAITTLLSYQVAGLIADLLLGFKPRRTASASALQTVLLVRHSSPLAVLTNLFRSDSLARLYYARDIPPDTAIARDKEPVRIASAARLFILLLAAPLASIASVVLTLSTEENLSFSAAGFRGVALGIPKPGAVTIKGEPTSHTCSTVPIEVAIGDTSLVDFSICENPQENVNNTLFPRHACIGVGIGLDSILHSVVGMGTLIATRHRGISLYSNKSLYYVKVELSTEGVNRVLDFGMEKMARALGTDRAEEKERTFDVDSPNWKRIDAKCVPFEVETQEVVSQLATDILDELDGLVTFVEAEKIMVAKSVYSPETGPGPELPYVDGSEMLLLSRRRRYLALSALTMVTALVVVVRAMIMIMCSNDVGIGLERTVKETLGYHCCESLMDEKGDTCYNIKHQYGQVGHYGMPRHDMPRVEQFSSGVLGQRSTELTKSDYCEAQEQDGHEVSSADYSS